MDQQFRMPSIYKDLLQICLLCLKGYSTFKLPCFCRLKACKDNNKKQNILSHGLNNNKSLVRYIQMNKFNKKLTISLPQEPIYTHENQSPSVQDHEQQMIQNDKESLLQFREFRDGVDSQFGDNRNEHISKLNFVQFEQFNAYGYSDKTKKQEDNWMKKGFTNKRNVVIELPDRDQDRKFKIEKQNDIYVNNNDEEKFKEPPAPSKGSRLSKVFVFPTTPGKNQEKGKQKQKQKQESESKQELKKSFERQRQEFYKQKSKLQKQILIKNGQIQMLHKLLTENLSNPQRANKSNQNYQYISSKQQLETILLQKDLQINQLLEKISELNNILSRKNEELGKKTIEINSLNFLIESLKNQLYIYERKDSSEKLTKKYYQIQAEKSKQQPEQMRLSKQFGTKGLESLYKRIEMVRMNRIQFDSRNKIKQDVSYSQTAKSRAKGAFDFKGKTFDANSNTNKTRLY